ncbi:MAG: haloacid dehalogenase [Isosphaera sp.]|nr:haloacid dehalogenase [Isosphaera sp.]
MPPAEVVNPNVRRGPFRAVLFDFDGTLSLIREGWPAVMVGMMLDRLREQSLARDGDADLLDDLVMGLNGQPTARQMEAFAAEVGRRGGAAADPAEYLRDYADRLMGTVRGRWDSLASGAARPADWVVPGAHALLTDLRDRGVPLFVASGTDHAHVAHEARLLGVDGFFPAGIDAPRAGDPAFTKAAVIARVLAELGIRGEGLLGFGDGVVETAEVKRVGGVAVGVASAPAGAPAGTVQSDKRARLVAAGADLIVPDYGGGAELLRWLWDGA